MTEQKKYEVKQSIGGFGVYAEEGQIALFSGKGAKKSAEEFVNDLKNKKEKTESGGSKERGAGRGGR